MAFDNKYGRIALNGSDMEDDEPCFIIRARDLASADAIHDYADRAEDIGASPEFVEAVHQRATEFDTWQGLNGDLTKIPD